MATKFFRFHDCSKARIFCYWGVLILAGIMLLSLTYFKESKMTKADSVKLEQTQVPMVTTTGSDQSKLKTPEKANFTTESVTEKEKGSLTNHNWEYLRYSMRRDPGSITVTKNTDGSSTAFLNGTFKTVSAARRLPDGRLVIQCFESFDALEKFMTSTTTESAVVKSK